MTRYRTVHCLIWNDDKFPFVSDDCQLVWFHILTTPFSTPFGLFKATIEMLASEKRWSVKRYTKAFQEGLGKGFFRYNENRQLVYLPKHVCYNPPHNPNVLKSWGKIYNELPDCDLKQAFYQSLKGFLESYGEGFKESFNESFSKGMLNDPDTDTATSTDLSIKNNVKASRVVQQGSIKYNDDFEQFWERYPRKINKKKAYDAWNKFNSDRPPIEDILKSVDAHKKSNQWAVNKYIPHPTTWLNGHGWLNEVDDLEEIPF